MCIPPPLRNQREHLPPHLSHAGPTGAGRSGLDSPGSEPAGHCARMSDNSWQNPRQGKKDSADNTISLSTARTSCIAGGQCHREANVTLFVTDRATSQLLWDLNRQPTGCRPFSIKTAFVQHGEQSTKLPTSPRTPPTEQLFPKRSLCPVQGLQAALNRTLSAW